MSNENKLNEGYSPKPFEKGHQPKPLISQIKPPKGGTGQSKK